MVEDNYKLKFVIKTIKRKSNVKFENNFNWFQYKIIIYIVKLLSLKSNQISHPYKIRVVSLVTFFSWQR